jgi:glycosyltransferase involved in cell wall biosynthesis
LAAKASLIALNISFVNNQYRLGGAETVILQLRRGLKGLNHKTSLYVADGKIYPPGVKPLYPRLLSRLYHSRFRNATEFLFPRRAWTDRTFRKLGNDPSDLIHLHNFHGNYATVASLAQLAERKKVVWTFHAFWGVTGGCDHPKSCSRYLATCGACPQVGVWPIGAVDDTAEQLQLKLKLLGRLRLNVVAPSKWLANKVRESKVGKIWNVFHIPNGVNPDEFASARKRDPQLRASFGLRPETTSVLVVNRNFKDVQKGFQFVREALSNIEAQNIEIILVGENSDWAGQEISSQNRIVSMGYISSREKMAALYEVADVFLFASPAENFPCVILEAMSAECCVTSTPTSGVTEQIEHGRTGFLAETISGRDLSRTLNEVLASGSLREIGSEAKKRVRSSFSEKQMVQRHLALYEDILCS